MAISASQLPGYEGDTITKEGLRNWYLTKGPGASQDSGASAATDAENFAAMNYGGYEAEQSAAAQKKAQAETLSSTLSKQLQSYRDYVATQREQVSKLQSYLSDPANLEAERKLAVAQATRQLGSEYASRGLSKSGHMSSALERVVYESQAKASSDLINRQLQSTQLGYQMGTLEQSLASAEIGNTQWMANYQNALASLDLQKQQLAFQQEQAEGGFFDTLKGIVGIGTAAAGMYSGISMGSYYGAAASNLKSGYSGISSGGAFGSTPTMANATPKF